MFKELMPQNEALGTILDTVLITLGGIGGIAGLITFRWKTKYQAKIQAEMQAKADELSQTLNEKITRRSKAFELQINKEYEFYEKFGLCIEKLVLSLREIDKSLNRENGKENPNAELLLEKYEALTSACFELERLIISHAIYLDESDLNYFSGIKNSTDKYCNFVIVTILKIRRKEKIDNLEETIDEMANDITYYLGEASDMINRKMKDAIHTN